ncbi:MAG TPA: HD domain-containing protein [Blastocatellia bacterium]|nr:HD domain-containing protein [Blastocatellia bacterium]
MAQRNYRDPLHNIISLDESLDEDRLIVDLIDTPEFQRLRRIKQLGLAMFTYQGAEHSRFTHSLGVMHLMTRALNLLGAHHQISDEARVVGRAGALLHDLGHGPFSHVIENVFRFHHEDWSRAIVLDPATGVNATLRRFDSTLPEKITSVYDHQFAPAFVSQLVSSQLDCDRMDYLLRDSLMTGAKYGIYDLEWVLHALRIDAAADRVYVDAKGLYAVEEYLQARYYMFRQVYFHRTLRSAEVVLVSTLKRARELIGQDRLGFRMRGSALEKMLMSQAVTAAEYLQLDDTDITFHLKQWAADPDPILADLASRFIGRRLFKAIDLDLPEGILDEFNARANELVRDAGFDPDYYLAADRASDIPYYGYYSPAGVDPRSLIYVESTPPRSVIREISEVSEVVRGMRGYGINRVCFPSEVAEAMSKLIDDCAGKRARAES